MDGDRISTGDTFYYEDSLQRLEGLKVLSIPQDSTYIGTVDPGKTGIKVDCNIPKELVLL